MSSLLLFTLIITILLKLVSVPSLFYRSPRIIYGHAGGHASTTECDSLWILWHVNLPQQRREPNQPRERAASETTLWQAEGIWGKLVFPCCLPPGCVPLSLFAAWHQACLGWAQRNGKWGWDLWCKVECSDKACLIIAGSLWAISLVTSPCYF